MFIKINSQVENFSEDQSEGQKDGLCVFSLMLRDMHF